VKRTVQLKAGLLAATAIILGSTATANAQVVEPLLEEPAEEAQLATGNIDVEAEDYRLTNADERIIVTMGGSINPFAGNIDPFGGSIDPFGGSIDPFGGSIDPFGGSIDPFGGNINPFHGEIRSLWGRIDPFGGNVDPFGGDIDPFAGTINPFYGKIDPYKGNIDSVTGVELPNYLEINSFWHEFGATWRTVNKLILDAEKSDISSATYTELQSLSNLLIKQTENAWGAAISARKGGSAKESFLAPLFEKFGVAVSDPNALLKLTRGQRAQLVSEWFDGLMGYTGFDHVDHWMSAVNWNPELTKIQGSGADSVIGILDGSIVNGPEFEDNVFHSGGYTSHVGGHGVGVASLILAKHDGQGVMGIAPNASVATYNPFDHSGTSSWSDIRDGIVSLKQSNASVINMSLGIKGWTLHPEWNNVFNDSAVRKVANSTVFVIAAGNDGSTQTENIEWKKNLDTGLIIVGAVDALGNISRISNKPGTACFAEDGKCSEGSYLRDIFLVAPGELILMSDGEGGVVRRSGTSFAAPLVSGAITLLHDRWPWLAKEPEATVKIILESARDLGEPGVDDVYGHGLLDVEASQSPLVFDALDIYEHKDGKRTKRLAADLKSAGVGETWNTEGVFLTLFETVGKTHRDFAVPFSDSLIGQKTSANGSPEYFQSYITKRFKNWSKGTDQKSGSKSQGFSDVASYENPDRDGWSFGFSMSSPTGFTNNGLPGDVPHSAFKFSNDDAGLAFHAGYGQGAIALLNQNSFGLISDYNANNGGLNPVLGLASGGGFLDAEFKIAKNTKIAFGITNRNLSHADNFELTQKERAQLRGADDYQASAFNLRLSHKPSSNTNVSVSFAMLDEKDGLLGVQSSIDSNLRHGSSSKTGTVSGSVDLPHQFSLGASATIGVTNSKGGNDQDLRTRGGVMSSAFAISMGKQGVIGKNDQFRLSISQPLHLESGTLEYRSIEVINRQTGEIGSVTRSFGIADKGRRFNAEFIYATPIMKGGELSFFGRAEYDSSARGDVNQIIAGGMLSLAL
jgi:Subtilase family